MRLRSAFTAAVTGALIVGSAWAGTGLLPVPTGSDATREANKAQRTTAEAGAAGDAAGSTAKAARKVPADVIETGNGSAGTFPQAALGPDELLVGAAKVNLAPQPDASKGEVWVRDKDKCLPVSTDGIDPQGAATHAADWRSPWIENNNCIYMGGFGVGPSQPILEFDTEYGLWSRSVAFRRGEDTLVLTIIDAEGYNGLFRNMCPKEKACGAIDLSQQLGEELGVDPASFVFASTHAHSAMDLIGGWGGVPEWYMRQVAEAMRTSARRAVADMRPALLEAGDTVARRNNSERRASYYSAEDPTMNWLRARGRDGRVIATVGTFAAHATSFGSSATVAHADWPGVFDKAVEEKFGGTGLMFEAGLGNMSASGNNKGSMGKTLADLLPPVGAGTPVPNPVVKVDQAFWDQPVTNMPLNTLGVAGFFDRRFETTPAQVEVAKKDWRVPCRSAGATSVRTQVSAATIGDVVVTAAPGEIFSNFSNTVEERSTITSLAIAQANDALGYMPQSFESNDSSRQGGGFIGEGVFEYEDAYAIDRCFGDKALAEQLRILEDLRK